MHPHGDGAAGVAAQRLDPVHQVGTELVASLQHAQHHDVVVAQVVHDVSSQTLRPVNSTDTDPRLVCIPTCSIVASSHMF